MRECVCVRVCVWRPLGMHLSFILKNCTFFLSLDHCAPPPLAAGVAELGINQVTEVPKYMYDYTLPEKAAQLIN